MLKLNLYLSQLLGNKFLYSLYNYIFKKTVIGAF